jgi:hypothetical protein
MDAGFSRSPQAWRGRDGVRRPGLKTGISGMMRTRLNEEGLNPPHRTHEAPSSLVVNEVGQDLDLPVTWIRAADPAAYPPIRVRTYG